MARGKRRVKRCVGKRNARSEGANGGVPNLRAWGGQVRAARGHLEIRAIQFGGSVSHDDYGDNAPLLLEIP